MKMQKAVKEDAKCRNDEKKRIELGDGCRNEAR
jgi:hypothetical protein